SHNLGITLLYEGKLDDAERFLRDAHEKRRKFHGDESQESAGSLVMLAQLAEVRGRLDEAEALNRRALEVFRATMGPDSSMAIDQLDNIARVIQAQGKLGEAGTLAQQALEARRRDLGPEHIDTLISMNTVGSIDIDQGRYAEAAELLSQAEVPTRTAFAGANAFRTAVLLTSLGRARTGLRDFALAERNLLEAHEIFGRARPRNPKDLRNCVDALARLYVAWDKAEPGKGHDAEAAKWQASLEAGEAQRG
ncbi:MAG TPA: tetratricopeptide repeat protein, partial [Xanthomonadales bacterium]|nr:tetratricopeptide repeat protein [Xanthomonadales bacterium]